MLLYSRNFPDPYFMSMGLEISGMVYSISEKSPLFAGRIFCLSLCNGAVALLGGGF